MKQEKKTELTKIRIMKAAIQEFGTKGYAGASLNTICSSDGIPKGLLYHNYSGKDELYLACVADCFADVTEYLRAQNIQYDLEKYMQTRMRYFEEHPHRARIFFEAILQPPIELIDEIQDARKEFVVFNRHIYQSAISRMILREGVTQTDALEYYEIMQEMFNGYFSSPSYAGKSFETVVSDHEESLSKMLNLMLYGIGKKRE